MTLISCSIEKPGEGEQATFALKNMFVLQSIIYDYKIENGKFPDDLTFLKRLKVPFNYKIYETNVSIDLIDYKFTSIYYRNMNDYFELEITYGPPGRNIIKYDKINQKWDIYGYY